MPFSWNDILWGLAVPLITAAGLRLLLVIITQHFFSQDHADAESREHAAEASFRSGPLETSVPLAMGAAVGYFVLKLGPWAPEAHYEWLPCGVAIAVLASLTVSFLGQSSLVRFGVLPIVYATATGGIGYLLMPTWEDLSPPYGLYLLSWWLGVSAISITTDYSPESDRWSYAVVWLGTCLTTTAIVAISESLRFAQIAGLTFSATLGIVAAGLFMRRSLLSGVGLTLTTYLAGILLIAHVNSWSEVALFSYWLPMAGLFLAALVGMIFNQKLSATLQAALVIVAAAIPSSIAVIFGIVATLSE